jgi:UDP-glucose 4-epimerase
MPLSLRPGTDLHTCLTIQVQRTINKDSSNNNNIHILAIFLHKVMKNILVTGGAGFIGVQVLKKLLSLKANKIIVIDNLSNANSEFSDCILKKETETALLFYKEDIRNKKAILDIVKDHNIDTCIHLAAIVSVLDSITDPDYTVDVNINGTFNILDACSRIKVRNFIFSSSCAVYGQSTKLPLSEENAPEPFSPYGASKVAGEVLVSSYRKTKKIRNAVSLRIFNVYGGNQNPQYAGVITKFAKRLAKGLAPTIYGDGQQTRDFIHVDDVVRAIILAASVKASRNDELSSYTFNVGTGSPTSVNALARNMLDIFGLNLRPVYLRTQVGEMRYCYADTTKSRTFLNFVARESFESKLNQIVSNILSKNGTDSIRFVKKPKGRRGVVELL